MPSQAVRWVVRTGLWVPAALLSGLIVWNTLPYFSSPASQDFLLERPALTAQPVWRIAFFVHIAGGIVCVLSALGQFSMALLRRAPIIHRVAGRTYGVAVLALLVPSGAYLSLHAKGGLSGQLGFGVLTIWTGITTWMGIRTALQRRIRAHKEWMVRSYAMIATAMSFRVLYLALYAAEVPHHYIRAVWLSFLLNLLVGEWVVTSMRKGATR